MSDEPIALPEALRKRMLVAGVIGRGGMGVVYRARDAALKRDVAIKLMRHASDAVSGLRFAREGRGLAQLSHPNIVRVLDGGYADGVHYLVMELLEGESLEQVLKEGRLPPAEVRAVLSGMLRGLVHVHAAGLLHRDLKPSNVFMREGREPVLIDFGLVRQEREITPLTMPGSLVGTPAYLAPELLDNRPASVASDLFALGCVGHQLVAGRHLHEDLLAGGASGIVASLCSGVYFRAAGRQLAPYGGLGDAVLRALAPLPEHRFATAGDMLAAVEAATLVTVAEPLADHAARTQPLPVEQVTPAPVTPGPATPAAPRKKSGSAGRPTSNSRRTRVRARYAGAVAAVVLAAAGGLLAVALWLRSPPRVLPHESAAPTPSKRPPEVAPSPPADALAAAEAAVADLRAATAPWRDAWDVQLAARKDKPVAIGYRSDQMREFYEARGRAAPQQYTALRALARRTLQRAVTSAVAVLRAPDGVGTEHRAALAVREAMTWADALGAHSIEELAHAAVRLRGTGAGFGSALVAAQVAQLRHESLDELDRLREALDDLEARLPAGQLVQRDLLALWLDVAELAAHASRSYRVTDAVRDALGRRLLARIPTTIPDTVLTARAHELVLSFAERPAIRGFAAPLLENLHGLLASPKPRPSSKP